MRILFAGRPIACEMGVLEVFIVRFLFTGRPIACEMVVLKVFMYSKNFICRQANCMCNGCSSICYFASWREVLQFRLPGEEGSVYLV